MSQDARPFRWRYGELDDKSFHLHGHNIVILLLLFSFLVVLLLLCFYFRRRCCYAAASPTAAAAGGGQGMDEAAVRKLPVTVRRGEAAVCSICLGLLMEGEKEKVLPVCSHGFHPVCVDEWLRKRSSCPVCRAMVTGEDPPEVVVAVAVAVEV